MSDFRMRKVALADERGVVNLGTNYAGRYFDLVHHEDGRVELIPVEVHPAGQLPSNLEGSLDQ